MKDITVQDVEDGMQQLHDTWSKGVLIQVLKEQNREVHEEYMKEKKQKAVENTKRWCEEKKDKVKANRRRYNQKEMLCECGRRVKHKHKTRHEKSAYHLKRAKTEHEDGPREEDQK
jgi:exopolyphosphatase/pppGpp-phosphohydrolase